MFIDDEVEDEVDGNLERIQYYTIHLMRILLPLLMMVFEVRIELGIMIVEHIKQ